MTQKSKKWLTFTLRWGIAVVGIWWVLSQITWRDRVTTLNPQMRPVSQRLANTPPLDAPQFKLLDGRTVDRSELISLPDQKTVTLTDKSTVELLGLDLSPDLKRVNRLLIAPAPGGGGPGQWITPALTTGYTLKVPHPLIEAGIGRMIHDAASGHKPWLLVFAILIFPITYIVTSFRWHQLLRALDIHLTLARTFALNMVGAFYNTFMLGSTGGDVIKAYYASKQTGHRTRAVLSVFVDRFVGLIALVIMGGAMAAYQFFTSPPGDPAAHACGKIALISALIVFGTAAGLAVFYNLTLRRLFGLAWFIKRFGKRKQVKSAVETMELYRKHAAMVVVSLIATFPVHITVVLSAMFAGWAFGLTISPLYYFVAVPVIVLVGSIPISPQGAGVMEYFAILLLSRQGGTVSQAFALTMSIRMVQILWNLTGGIFVFRGGYHQPTEAEQQDLGPDPDVGGDPPTCAASTPAPSATGAPAM
jgi:uncharacterized protein (TIRG00374 family)